MSRTKGKAIQPKDFSSYMNDLLDEYGAEIVSITIEAADNVSKGARTKLRQKSTGSFKDITGSYRRGWRAQLKKSRIGVFATVYNATDYRLTHLLEYGHAMRGGGRSKEFPHISDVNAWAIEQFELALARGIEEANSK